MQKDQIPNLDLAYNILALMEMMEAPEKSEFFYHHRAEDDWEKKMFESFTNYSILSKAFWNTKDNRFYNDLIRSISLDFFIVLM